MYGVPEALPVWDCGLYFIMEAGVADGGPTHPSADPGLGGGGIHISDDADRGDVVMRFCSTKTCEGCGMC